MTQPRIGITTSYKDSMQSVDHHYVQAIESSGGIPVIIPMVQNQTTADDLTSLLDGLVITGGPGITQGLIGNLPQDLPPVDPVRSNADKLIFNTMTKQGRPVLGICYGMQFINAQAGGTIYADVHQQLPGTLLHSAGRGGTDHTIRIKKDSHLYTKLQRDSLTVNTYHIQAVAALGSGLRAVAHGPDGVIEAIESTDGQIIGVQFHPERMLKDMHPLFKDLIERCKRQ